MDFRITGLSATPFRPLFALTDRELAERGARRVVADETSGIPCRVSLLDAVPGETAILLSYAHQPAATPYQAAGPIFVREAAQERFDAVNEVPAQLRRRLLSVRAYDRADFIVDADVVEGAALDGLIERFFARRETDYLHAHFAKYGCYACRIERA